MIRLLDVSVGHGAAPLVEGLSLDAPTGSILALVGASGSGKTTLLRAIAGLHPTLTGRIELLGMPPRALYGSGRLHFLHQSPSLWRHLTVVGHIRLALQLVGAEVRPTHVSALVSQLGLDGSEGKYPHELSRGMQARLALARAFAEPPDVLLVDEPFANLDHLRREQLNNDLRRLSATSQCTIVMVTHDVVEAVRFATDILVFRRHTAELRRLHVPRGMVAADPHALPREARALRDEIMQIIADDMDAAA